MLRLVLLEVPVRAAVVLGGASRGSNLIAAYMGGGSPSVSPENQFSVLFFIRFGDIEMIFSICYKSSLNYFPIR